MNNQQTNPQSAASVPEPPKALAEKIRANQQQLGSQLRDSYDSIVCGAGSSGSVIARRLAAENPSVRVLLLEAGGTDNVMGVMEQCKWLSNLVSECDWCVASAPEEQLNGRSIPLSMGKVLGGGSSIPVMVWVRGHKAD